MHKLLKAIFALLLVLTIGEIIYYFIITKQIKFPLGKSNLTPSISVTPAIHPDTLSMFAKYAYDPNSKITVKTEFQTKIKDIAYDGRESGGSFYPFAMELITSNGREFWMLFPDYLYKKVKVFSKSGDNLKPIKTGELKVGDNVQLNETYNPYFSPLDPQQAESYEIYKIE
ncbi:hypothetical protein A3J20_01685 [Candidatus Gottesmanbacteria bacterium RIFCSPLOWO2_02_FULL_42_29]|uniref:Uncharacterized protein n=2 Tax=Candidatus Gottesmaniibacteriota TaxID=1752720 RepID=A0A1F6BBE1_9BACT|nr:MAG: hypothetical protein UV09_C0018G0005 [Candidatus Gottesmanbacteria bacterium GW2011_GWA2_42_18]OGG10753.1 MAG: hypothetical protein A2781_03780 [Candidatus Gottesmanbacteria bacterium RIFCSPHIGHO2_01_FULL_42_27]OGG21916.1 MAG: hypothetical protein A3E72_01715 [Candidatus Gottesmanbacteria bacterium RIFCSPHIGHO2_12_FULL_43_26]OGG34188.1 MAG: hypothetical protein A2968_03370 [Candidatus Gottesmanbacteria bacterium RIFCSPLOWO2_01_FULL_42_22]OGG35942.1 MAG: hypothetical protein A3G68_07385 